MKSLLLKDFYNLARSGRVYLAILLLYSILSYFNGGSMMLVIATVLSLTLPMTALGYDEKDQWDALCLTMPLTPFTIVLEKYILALTCCTLGILLGGGGGWILGQLGNHGQSEGYPATVGAIFLIVLLYNAVTLPVNLRMGVERGRFVSVLLLMLPFMAIILLERQGILAALSSQLITAWFSGISGFFLAAAGILFLMTVSFLISLRIYRKKEW